MQRADLATGRRDAHRGAVKLDGAGPWVVEVQQVGVAEARRKQQLLQRLHAAPATNSPCLTHREQESKLESKQARMGWGRVSGVVWC